MNVLHFVNAYFPSTGGTVTRVHNLFFEDSHQHTLIVPVPTQDDQTSETVEQISNLEVVRVPVAAPRGLNRFRGSYYRRQADRLMRHALKRNPDILYGHNPLTCALASLAFHRQRPDIPFVYEAHGIMRDYSNVGPGHPLSALRDGITRRALGRFEAPVFKAVDCAIAQTRAAGTRIKELYRLPPDRIFVVHNGVDLDRFDPRKWNTERDALRSKHGWQDNTIVFYAGYLDEVNGIAALLEATRNLSEKAATRIKVVIAGKGPRAVAVEDAARQYPSRLEFLGSVPHDAMPAYYAASDVFVIPRPPFRPAETLLPMKLLEAMAMEKVVLVSNVGGMTDVVHDNRNGMLFAKGDTAALTEQLERCADLPPSMTQWGKAARVTVKDRFCWKSSRAQLNELFEAVVNQKKA